MGHDQQGKENPLNLKDRADVTEADIARLRDRLSRMQLSEEEDWDSLDLAEILAAVEIELGAVLPDDAVGPGDIANFAALIHVLRSHGRRTGPRVTLRLAFDSTLQRSRRELEHQLSTRFPRARLATSRNSIDFVADDVADLPVALELTDILGVKAPSDDRPSPPSHGTAFPNGRAGESVNQAMMSWVRQQGGEIWAPAPSLISFQTLRELGYLEAHNDQVIRFDDEFALCPAACLHAYATLPARGSTSGLISTFVGTVFRHEPPQLRGPGRLPAFTVREILWFGPPGWCDDVRSDVLELITKLARDAGIAVRAREANDPFFRAVAERETKVEIRTLATPRNLAIASINRHQDHFTRRIATPEWHTGCAGVGLERWIMAAGGT